MTQFSESPDMNALIPVIPEEQEVYRDAYDRSRERVQSALQAETIGDAELNILAEELFARRSEDLRGLTAEEQAEKIASSALTVLPLEELQARLRESKETETPLHIKYGIDPTGSEVHLGHAVPMLLLDRFQRMGHRISFIIGTYTAKIGDPSGKVASRPVLTDEDITQNMQTYTEQVAPLFDMSKVDIHRNGDWEDFLTSQLMPTLSQVQIADLLQRRDFRDRLESGSGLTAAEIMYPVVMALDSVRLGNDIEIGGKDQLLNMQMGRKVMAIHGQRPQVVVTTDILEGTDGSGAKMSKSLGNYVGLTHDPKEIYGRIMSIPDTLLGQYFGMLTELEPQEWDQLNSRMETHQLNPMAVKKLLARDLITVLHGHNAAAEAETSFTKRFSRRDYTEGAVELPNLPEKPEATLLERLASAHPTGSIAGLVRIMKNGGIRLIDAEGTEIRPSTRAELEELLATKRFARIGKLVVKLVPEDE